MKIAAARYQQIKFCSYLFQFPDHLRGMVGIIDLHPLQAELLQFSKQSGNCRQAGINGDRMGQHRNAARLPDHGYSIVSIIFKPLRIGGRPSPQIATKGLFQGGHRPSVDQQLRNMRPAGLPVFRKGRQLRHCQVNAEVVQLGEYLLVAELPSLLQLKQPLVEIAVVMPEQIPENMQRDVVKP